MTVAKLAERYGAGGVTQQSAQSAAAILVKALSVQAATKVDQENRIVSVKGEILETTPRHIEMDLCGDRPSRLVIIGAFMTFVNLFMK